MSGPLTFHSPARLALVFTLVAGIPLAVLGWFGRRSLIQERDLARLLLAERLGQTAALISRDVEAELVRWEAIANTWGPGRVLPSGATMLVFTADSVTSVHGERLPYYAAVPRIELPDDERLRRGRQAEFVDRDLPAAIARYEDAVTSTGRTVRATALASLGRCLRNQKQTDEALAAYEELARMTDAQVAGFPAALVARRERQAIYAGVGDTISANRERDSMLGELRAAAHLLDRPTFDAFASSLAPAQLPAAVLARADAVVDFWLRWQQSPSGRVVGGTGASAMAAVWRSGAEESMALVAPIETLLAQGLGTAERFSASIALESSSGQTVWGDAVRTDGSATLSLTDIGLPATIRVSLVGAAGPHDSREIIFIAAFVLLATVVAVAAYAIFRSVNREVGVARLQSEFVATVSHEFRSPLTAMRHLTETLEEGGASGERLPDYFRALAKETRRLQATVESVLDFGRMESGHRGFEMREVDAVSLARTVADDFATVGANRVEISAATSTLAVRADYEALSLALRNLVDNALKYSSPSAPVTVTVEAAGREARIAVRDRGPGMAQDEQREVFRKFVRGSAARTINVKGTGLGLALVDRIIRAHGGRVDVESSLGRGSVFTIVLPVRSTETGAA